MNSCALLSFNTDNKIHSKWNNSEGKGDSQDANNEWRHPITIAFYT